MSSLRRAGAPALLMTATLAVTLGCQRVSDETAPGVSRPSLAATARSAEPAVALASVAPSSDALPEDPAAGARSLALWREHLEEEERERKANYDRRHLSEHRVVVARLRAAKKRLDGAASAAALKQVQASLVPELARIRALVEKIDHWRVSSNVVRDYEALADAFATSYPEARLAELERQPATGDARASIEAQLKRIDEWLAYAEKAEDE